MNVKQKILSYIITCVVSLLVGGGTTGAIIYFYTKNTIRNVESRAEEYKETITELREQLTDSQQQLDTITAEIKHITDNNSDAGQSIDSIIQSIESYIKPE